MKCQSLSAADKLHPSTFRWMSIIFESSLILSDIIIRGVCPTIKHDNRCNKLAPDIHVNNFNILACGGCIIKTCKSRQLSRDLNLAEAKPTIIGMDIYIMHSIISRLVVS